jgi:hypothetical protein
MAAQTPKYAPFLSTCFRSNRWYGALCLLRDQALQRDETLGRNLWAVQGCNRKSSAVPIENATSPWSAVCTCVSELSCLVDYSARRMTVQQRCFIEAELRHRALRIRCAIESLRLRHRISHRIAPRIERIVALRPPQSWIPCMHHVCSMTGGSVD